MLGQLQNPAPSGTEIHLRTPVLQELIAEAGVPSDEFDIQFMRTGSPAVLLTTPKGLWMSAHSDTISYLPPLTNETAFSILPSCAHRPTVAHEWPAATLRYNSQRGTYEVISTGIIGSDENMRPYYTADTKPKDGFQPGIDRIVYTPTLAVDNSTGLLTGNMDNAAGLTVTVLSLRVLAELARQRNIPISKFGVGFVFPGQEEGLPDNPAYFAREARRIIHRTAYQNLPYTIINVDGHDSKSPQPAVRYAAYVSSMKGPVVSPEVYARFENFLLGLSEFGVVAKRTEDGAAVSRSDDAAYTEVVRDVVPVGYDVKDPHFNDGPPTTNLLGLINTAKSVAWIAAQMGSELK